MIDHPMVGKLGPHFLDVSLHKFRGGRPLLEGELERAAAWARQIVAAL